jgi:hypothetical protein
MGAKIRKALMKMNHYDFPSFLIGLIFEFDCERRLIGIRPFEAMIGVWTEEHEVARELITFEHPVDDLLARMKIGALGRGNSCFK